MNCSETQFNTTQETGERMRDMNDLRLRAQAALEKFRNTRQKIEQCHRGLQAGDVFVFAETAEAGIEWVTILRHVDDPSLWFCLPMDMSPMIGTDDVEVTEASDVGPAAIRCGSGLWMHEDFVTASGDRSGFLESRYVRKAANILRAMVTGDDTGIKVRRDVDDDPDYQEWMEDVTVAANRLEESRN